MELSDAGLRFLKAREGVVNHMYEDNAGHCTIGVGHLIHKGRCIYPTIGTIDPPYPRDLSDEELSNLRVERPFTRQLTDDEVNALLVVDKRVYEQTINDYVRVPLNQVQFDALVSFCFNVGQAHFTQSTVLKLINRQQFGDVPAAMRLWNSSTTNGVRSINQGMVNRREKEIDLFVDGRYQ